MSYVLYRISCAVNGKAYIGYTKHDAEKRFLVHLLNARWNRKYALADAIRVYGADAFTVETLEVVPGHAEAARLECLYIAAHRSMLPHGYNMTKGGDGVPLPAEKLAEMNEKKRGRCSPKQLEANRRRAGQPLSAETRAKLSAARKGKPKSAAWIEARRGKPGALRGRPWSPARREAQMRRTEAS